MLYFGDVLGPGITLSCNVDLSTPERLAEILGRYWVTHTSAGSFFINDRDLSGRHVINYSSPFCALLLPLVSQSRLSICRAYGAQVWTCCTRSTPTLYPSGTRPDWRIPRPPQGQRKRTGREQSAENEAIAVPPDVTHFMNLSGHAVIAQPPLHHHNISRRDLDCHHRLPHAGRGIHPLPSSSSPHFIPI